VTDSVDLSSHRAWIIGATAVLGASGLAARQLSDRELVSFHLVNRTPGWLTGVLWAPMQLGAAASPFVIAGVLAATRREPWLPIGIAATGLGSWFAAKGVKLVLRRGRPSELVAEANVRVGASRTGLGFVSGHAAVAASLATVLWPVVPSTAGRLGLVAGAAVIGLARVQNGSHLPLDVVGGFALGSVLGHAWGLLGPCRRS
jgi:undecaprenyl-diphosphatase